MKRAGLMLLFASCLIAFPQQAFAASEHAPKDAYIGGSSHPLLRQGPWWLYDDSDNELCGAYYVRVDRLN